MTLPVLKTLTEQNAEFTAWRRHLHQNPETAFEEVNTGNFVAEKLESFGVEVHRGLGKTGVVAVIKGKHPGTAVIGLRADMDALNMPEETNLPYASKIPGKMHACGHDGHTTTLLAAVKHLAATRDFAGTVVAVFQPAEEGGGGADVMIRDGFFDQFKCDAMFGMHNWPWLPAGKMAVCAGPVSAACDTFSVNLTGRGGHAAFPHKNIDVIACGAQIITALQNIVSRTVDPLDSAVVSVCNFNAGSGAHNVMPETASISGTVRTLQPATRKDVEERFRAVVKGITSAFGVTGDIDWKLGYPSAVNTVVETDFCRDIAGDVVGAENVEVFTPMMGGEDFAYFLEKSKGCYIVLGGGKTDNDPGLHSTHFDYNDDVLPVGAAYWVQLAEKYLKKG